MVPHHCRRIGAALGLVLVCAAAGCDMPAADPAPDPPAAEGAPEPATPLVPLNLEEAVNRAVDAAFAQYAKNPVAHAVTIAPVVNGITGEQSAATRKIADGIAARLRQNAGMLDITPFGADALGEKPYVVFASFTPRAADDKTEDTGTGYRLCLAVRDGGDGRLVGAATALVRADGVDPTPLRFFRDSPVWVRPTGPGTRRDT
jgi:hypothetical protein